MSKFKKPATGKTESGLHADTDENRNYARKWLEKYGSTRKPLEIFMSSDGLVVWFYFTPPKSGNRAFPLEMSQEHGKFKRQLDLQYAHYQDLLQSEIEFSFE